MSAYSISVVNFSFVLFVVNVRILILLGRALSQFILYKSHFLNKLNSWTTSGLIPFFNYYELTFYNYGNAGNYSHVALSSFGYLLRIKKESIQFNSWKESSRSGIDVELVKLPLEAMTANFSLISCEMIALWEN